MSDKFTIKNLFVYWLKMWPMILIFAAAGVAVGVVAVNKLEQKYKSSASVLVVNSSESAASTDYTGILNSKLVISKALEEAGLDDGACTLSAVNTGNIVSVAAECLAGEDDSKALITNAISVFSDTLDEIYGEGEVSVVVLSGEVKAAAMLSSSDYLTNLAVPIAAAVMASAVVAFVRFDYSTSKRRKR